ncbi:MAG: putative dehydrogenase [Planctomycetota bacterium]|jgi:predicted dehydrogenase
MSTVRIGILGNSFAGSVQLPALKVVGGNQVVGIAGAQLAKAKATADKWNIPLATDDYREVLALEPDLLIVSTPVHLHHKMVMDALKTKAAILCEKPFALNTSEAAQLVEAAQGRAALIDHQLRFSPVRRALREQLAAKAIGDVWHVEMDFSIAIPGFETRPYRWWYDEARGGGVFGALGSHMIDLLRFELGEVTAIRAQLDVLAKERKDADGCAHKVTADEHATFALRFESGARADLVTSTAVREARGFTTRYTGSQGTLLVQDEVRLLGGDSAAKAMTPAAGAAELPTAESLGMPNGGPFACALPGYLKEVLEMVRTQATTLEGAATFADGLAVQRILDAGRSSNVSGGGWVNIER